MDLDRLSLAVRPRTHWESVDLGFSLVRANLGAIYRPWLGIVVPVAVIVNLLCLDYLWLAALILWWLKPAYDRLLLHVLSHTVFGERPGVRDVLGALPGLLGRTGLLRALTFSRFNLARAFVLPVWQLEDLRGAALRARQKLLEKQARNAAVWHTVACANLEMVVNFGLLGLVLWMKPRSVELEFWGWVFAPDASVASQLVYNLFYFGAVSLIEPFYVAGGFTLYLNRRTLLEGWDIELAFRRLADRLKRGPGRRAA